MSIKIEKTENKNELKLEFTIEAKKFDEAILRVYGKSAKYFNIPGFRKGKAPFNIVERMYGDQIFYEDAFNELVPPIYEKEIEENKIEAVSKPHIDIVNMKKGEDLVFTAIVQTRPEVELGKYKGIELKKIEYPVTEKDIEHELEHMQEHNARTITVEDRAVKDKDIAVIDFEGFVDGKPFEGGKAEKHELGIGSKTFIPGFEDQVIGMKINEEKDINVKFPEEYFSKDLAGKDATFKVKLHEIKEKKLPELDDEFAKDVSEFDTLQQLKESIKEKMQAENDHKAKHETESAAIEAVAKNTKIDIPSGMIETEVDAMIRDLEQQLAYQGINVEQYLHIMNKTRKDLEDNYKEQAERNIVSRLILEEIIKAEKIEATDEEIAGTEIIQANINNTNNITLLNNEMKIVCNMNNASIEKEDNYFKVFSNDDIKYFDNNGNEISYKQIEPNNKMYAKKINGKWGFVNEENKLIINNEYDMVTEFNKYGFAGIKKGGKWGVVNIKGEIIQEPIYSFKWENPSFIGKYYKTKEWEQEYYTEELPE